MMTRFRVDLSADASMGCTVEVEAENFTKAEEAAIAKAKAGDVVWLYNGVADSSIEATYLVSNPPRSTT